MTLTITNTTKTPLPRIPFAKIAEAALGKEYDCSLVIVTPKKSRELNNTYREKDTSTNILSFPLGENEGEIFLDIKKVREEAPLFERSYTNFTAFLFIHGLLHLKGLDHGDIMEKEEKKIRKIFNI